MNTSVTVTETNEDTTVTVTSETTVQVVTTNSSPNSLLGLTDTTITSPSNGEVLQYNGTIWVNATVAGSGDVVGPSSATDNAIARFDTTTGKLIQDSSVLIDDSNNISGIGNITLTGTVDGRDVATDGTKLDGIESAATADQTTEEIQDAAWSAVSGGTQTGITVTYQDGTNDVDFVVGGLTTSEFASANISQWTNDSNFISNIVEDTTPQLGGDLDANGNNITDVHELKIDATPDTDHTANGPTTNTINAGTTVAIGELCYLASDGEWALADADAESTAAGLLSIALEAGTDTNPMNVALPGSFVRDDTWAWTVGAVLYVSTTAGAITETAPSATADVVRVVGYAVTADIIYFNPGGSFVEVA